MSLSAKIKDLRPRMRGLTIEAKVIDKSQVVNYNGKEFATSIIEDETGKIILRLWRNQVDQIMVGDSITIREAFVQGSSKRAYNLASWSDITVNK